MYGDQDFETIYYQMILMIVKCNSSDRKMYYGVKVFRGPYNIDELTFYLRLIFFLWKTYT